MDLSWKQDAACLPPRRRPDVDPAAFFPERIQRYGSYTEQREQIAAAKAVCATCPVHVECLAHAMETPERFGVWGGRSAKERERMHKERRRAG